MRAVAALLLVGLVTAGMWIANPARALPPTVILWGPDGGEDWTGSTVHPIDWYMDDDFDFNLTVWLDYSLDGGFSWNPIPGAQGIMRPSGNNTFDWTTPCTWTPSARARVTVQDSGNASSVDISAADFMIDCSPPFVMWTLPADGATNVSVMSNIEVGFNESMDNFTTESAFLITPFVSGSFLWPAPDQMVYVPDSNLTACTTFTVTIKAWAEDASDPGNTLGSDYAFAFTTECGGNTPPSVVLTSPAGGESWSGGSVHSLLWDPDDDGPSLTYWINYSLNGGGSWTAGPTGNVGTPYPAQSTAWTVVLADTLQAQIQICVHDGTFTTCDQSGNFEIDSTPPQILSVDPSDGATGVPLGYVIRVFWSEPMDVTAGTFDLSPLVPGTLGWNPTRTILEFTVTLFPCTVYTVFLVGFEDDSDPGNLMGSLGPNPFTFTTYCPTPPSVTVQRPAGGEIWAGGSTQLVLWAASDNESAVNALAFYVNYTSSAGSGTIAGPLTGLSGPQFSTPWLVPLLDATDARVDVTAIDPDGLQATDVSLVFAIDSTPPLIASYGPTGWNVPGDADVDAFFSEAVSAMLNFTAESFGLRDETASQWVPVTWVRVPPNLFLQEFHFVPDAPLEMCRDYRAYVNGTFFDLAGNLLANPTTWVFHTICAPSVSLLLPAGGEVWSGGTAHTVSCSSADEIDTQLAVWLNYSVDNGTDGYPFAAFAGTRPVGTVSLSWAVPLLNSTAVRLRLTVADSSGLTATARSAAFTIDASPPTVLTSVPSNNAYGVKITEEIQVVFTEAVDRASAVAGFSISPDPGGVGLSWRQTGLGLDILVVTHDPLKSKTDYTVTFGTGLRDLSDPGNHPAAPLVIAFTTKPPPNVQPPVALAVGKHQVEVGERITLDGSRSTGNITGYVWTITDNQNNIVDVLTGEVVTYTFRNHGRHAVTLRVTDEYGQSDEDTLEITVTSNPNGLILLSLASALGAAAILGGTEIGRYAVFTLLLALTQARRRNEKEDLETRGMIRGYLRVHPGDTYTEIKVNLGLNDGTVTWHLAKLEKEGLLKSQIERTRRRYYPAGMPLPHENGGELLALQRRLIDSVKAAPGQPIGLLAEALGVSNQLALYHLRRLSQKGLVSLERRGLRLRAYPGTPSPRIPPAPPGPGNA